MSIVYTKATLICDRCEKKFKTEVADISLLERKSELAGWRCADNDYKWETCCHYCPECK